MLTTVVVSTDMISSNLLRASLQQTGLVAAVREWTPSVQDAQIGTESVPDVVVLDLAHDVETFFSLASRLRRLHPGIHIIACASLSHPDPQLLMQAMRNGVQEFFPKPIDTAALREALTRFQQEKETAGGGRVATKVFVVAGAKGGVGATTVAVNLSVQMAQVSNRRVMLLDFARPLGQVSLLLDLQPKFSVRDAVENLDRLDAHFLGGLLTHHKSGVEVLAGMKQAGDWQGVEVAPLARVVNVAQNSCDYLLIDAGVASLPEWAPIFRSAQIVLLVAETNVPSLWGLERHLSAAAAAGLDMDRFRIVINRWRRPDDDTLRDVERKLKHPIFTRLPNDYRQASQALNTGMPLSGNHNSLLGGKFRQLAGQLAGVVAAKEKRSGLGSLFSR
jgi:pilus assembly protein CpaE